MKGLPFYYESEQSILPCYKVPMDLQWNTGITCSLWIDYCSSRAKRGKMNNGRTVLMLDFGV